jgi:hypothetical protein
VCNCLAEKYNSTSGLGFQKTEAGFPFYLGFVPFIFILILTNSPVPANDQRTHYTKLPPQYFKIQLNPIFKCNFKAVSDAYKHIEIISNTFINGTVGGTYVRMPASDNATFLPCD